MKTIFRIAIGLLALVPATLPAQVAVGTFTYTTSYNGSSQTGYVAILDTSDPLLNAIASGGDPTCAPDTVAFTRPSDFAKTYGTFLAITANTGPAIPPGTKCGTPHGLLISGGKIVNWPQTSGPVLYFDVKGAPTVTDSALPKPSGVMRTAVAGSISQDSDCIPLQIGTLLVKNGYPGGCPIPKGNIAAARGGIGVDATGRYVIVLVVTGQEGPSGLKTFDFALLMMAFHAVQAVNFDGGGSTTFIFTPNTAFKPCPGCNALMTNAAIPPWFNPNQLTMSAPQAVTGPITYWAQTPERAVYASIGFRILKLGE